MCWGNLVSKVIIPKGRKQKFIYFSLIEQNLCGFSVVLPIHLMNCIEIKDDYILFFDHNAKRSCISKCCGISIQHHEEFIIKI